jgi:hypothetical protein
MANQPWAGGHNPVAIGTFNSHFPFRSLVNRSFRKNAWNALWARTGSQAVEMIESTPRQNLGLAGARGLQAAAVSNPIFGFGDF